MCSALVLIRTYPLPDKMTSDQSDLFGRMRFRSGHCLHTPPILAANPQPIFAFPSDITPVKIKRQLSRHQNRKTERRLYGAYKRRIEKADVHQDFSEARKCSRAGIKVYQPKRVL
jgi:hypothetical protein